MPRAPVRRRACWLSGDSSPFFQRPRVSALPLRRCAPTPGFIALRPTRMDEEWAQERRQPGGEWPLRLGDRLGVRLLGVAAQLLPANGIASPPCLILRVGIHEHRLDGTEVQNKQIDKQFTTGYIAITGGWRPSAVSTGNGTPPARAKQDLGRELRTRWPMSYPHTRDSWIDR